MNKDLDAGLFIDSFLPDMHIYRIDTYSLLQAIVTDGAHYGFTDVSDPCLNTAVSPPTLCSNPYTNFFWDIEHPTIFGHAFFAVAAERRSTDKANSHRLCASELQAGKRKLACHAPRRTKRTMQHQHIDRAIDYIEFTTPDLPTIKKFYGSGFDWTFQDWGEEYSSFSDGRVDGGFARGDSPTGKGLLVILYSSSLEEVQQQVLAAGGKIVKDTFSFPGGRRFHFADPAGNELAIWSDK